MQTDTTLSILMSQGFSKTILTRFWPKVNKLGPFPQHCPELGPCWMWLAAKDNFGYGKIGKGSYDLALAHHVTWIIDNGPVPTGLCVLHKCDNPNCVNPHHLFLGTRQDNMADKMKKGRHVSNQKLTDEQVVEIFKAKGRIPQSKLAMHFGVNQVTISNIHNMKLNYTRRLLEKL